MQCNIDRRGRSLRMVIGVVTVIAATALFVLKLVGVLVSPAWWVAIAVMVPAGLFAVFEGWVGWCAVRAMGMKTPI